MSSPLFDALGSKPRQQPNMMQALSEFMRNFQGDPRAKVMELLNSGQMSQAQLKRYQQMASQIARMMGGS